MKNNYFDDEEMDSSDDSIENEEELIKEEGRGFIVDEDEDEDDEDNDIPKKSSKKRSYKDDDDDDDNDDNYEEEEDEEDLLDEVEDLIGNGRKRRLVRDSDDDNDDDFNYSKEKRSKCLSEKITKAVPKVSHKEFTNLSKKIHSRPQHQLKSKQLSKPNLSSPDLEFDEEMENKDELENEEFENEDEYKFNQKKPSENFSNLKSKPHHLPKSGKISKPNVPSPDLGSEEEIDNEDVFENEEQENLNEKDDENEYDEDDLDDFIVDSRKKKKSFDVSEDNDALLNTRQEKEAMALFGCVTADLENLDADSDYSDVENEDIDHTEVFNLEDLERGFHTEQDEIIRNTDLPERFQLKSLVDEDIKESDESLQNEAELLYEELFNERPWNKNTTCHLLVKILHMIRSKCYEIPYIYMYERDEITEKEIDFSNDDLWSIFDYHLKWKVVSTRKSKLLQIVDSIIENIPENDKTKSDRICAIRVELENIKNVNEARLIDELLSVTFTNEYKTIVGDSANTRLLNKFRLENSANLDKMILLFGMESYQYSLNVKENYMLHKIQDNENSPEETAEYFICSKFPTREKILQSARKMFAYQISKEISIYNYVNDFFKKNAKIKIRPTLSGCSMIDQKHELYKYKYITDKPITDFQKNYDYLLINQCERDKLVTTSIYLLENDKENLFNHLFSLFNKDEFNAIATAWNNQRKLIIEEAIGKNLIPEAVKKTRQYLSEIAQQKLAREIGGVLYRNINTRPYLNSSGNDKTIILGISYQNENSAAVVINEIGAVIRSVNLKNLTSKFRNNKDSMRSDINQIINLIETHRICAIAITGHCKLSLNVKNELNNAIKHADKELDIPHVEIEILNSDFSKVYEASTVVKSLYPQLNALQRQAVGVALNFSDPLVAFSHLMNYDKDIKNIKFHLHISLVNEDILLTQYERKFIEVVSKSGVDINNCLKHKNFQFTLQFVAGLGPRKSKELIERINKKCRKYYENNMRTHVEDAELLLTNRIELISKNYLDCIVAKNCAPFLKIVNVSDYDDGNILDETRINPMDYDFAIKIAQNILDMEENPKNAQLALRTVMNETDLSDLDFKSFADSIYERNNIKKHLIIRQINDELMNPFFDNRPSFIPLNDKDRFYLFTNEHEETLKIGTITEFRVVNFVYKRNQKDFDNAKPKRNEKTGYFSCPLCNKSDFVELNSIWVHFDNACLGKIVGVNLMGDNEISAFVSIRNIADRFVRNISDFIKIDQLVIGVVTKIDFLKMQLEVSLKESEITKAKNSMENIRDCYYDENAENKEKRKEKRDFRKINNPTTNSRVSFHPNFQNISYQEFQNKSNSLQNGDFIIRPSSKGNNRLTISWKISTDLFRHIDVLEENKETDYTIGKVLIVESEKYDDLDDIITNYLQPIINYTDDVFNYKYFKNIKAEDKHLLEAMIIKEKQINPNRIPYYIAPMYKYPGGFMFVLLPNNKVLYDSFLVTHEGYRFRNSVFQNIDRLVDNFKSHGQTSTRKQPFNEINGNLQTYRKQYR